MERENRLEDILRPVHKKRLYEDVEKQLVQLVNERKMKPGDKFPTESRLVKELNVSPSILREAFRILETKNLVESIQGGGRYLRQQIGWDAASKTATLIDVYQVRLILEPEAARLTALYCSAENLGELRRLLSSMQAAGKERDEDFPFHVAIAQMSQNAVLTRMIIDMINVVGSTSDEVFPASMWDIPMENYVEDHRHILEALEHRDAQKAKEQMYRHIEKSYLLIKNSR